MAEAFIIDATRSPTGKRKGSLQDLHAADLGAHVIKTIVKGIQSQTTSMMMSFSEQ